MSELARRVDESWGMLTRPEVEEILGRDAQHPLGDLIAVHYDGAERFPVFQFTSFGDIVAAIPQLTALARQHDWSSTDVFAWLVIPSSRLDGVVPADLLDTEEGQARVVAAVELEMSAGW